MGSAGPLGPDLTSLSVTSFLTSRGDARLHTLCREVTVSDSVYFKSNNKLKLNNKVRVIRSWDQSEALMICARCVSFLTW